MSRMFPINRFCAYNPSVLQTEVDTLAGCTVTRARFYLGKIELWTNQSITRNGDKLPSHCFDEMAFFQAYPDALTGFTSVTSQYGLSEGYAQCVNRYCPE